MEEQDIVEVLDIWVYLNPRSPLVVVVVDNTSQSQAEMVLLHLHWELDQGNFYHLLKLVLKQRVEGVTVKKLDSVLEFQDHLILVVEAGTEVGQPQVLWLC